MADMKKRRFLTPAESNELSRQVTQTRLKHSGVLAAAQKTTDDPLIGKLFAAVKKASAPNAKSTKSAKFADANSLKKLAGL
jgi:hypothetical protein